MIGPHIKKVLSLQVWLDISVNNTLIVYLTTISHINRVKFHPLLNVVIHEWVFSTNWAKITFVIEVGKLFAQFILRLSIDSNILARGILHALAIQAELLHILIFWLLLTSHYHSLLMTYLMALYGGAKEITTKENQR